MENKKTKLTISGSPKKSIKNIEIARTQGKNSVLIEKSKNNFQKKEVLKGLDLILDKNPLLRLAEELHLNNHLTLKHLQ